MTSTCVIDIVLEPPFEDAYRFRCSYGAEGAPLSEVEITLTPQEIEAFDERMIEIARKHMRTPPVDEAIAALLGRP